jgi:hypothetical protein
MPLYVLSAADLGTDPKNVESALESALERCRLWDAILLLDEGDVFLEARNSDSLKRNGLVSSELALRIRTPHTLSIC